MKTILKLLLRRAGILFQHVSSDPLISQIDVARNRMRMVPSRAASWTQQLSHIAADALMRDLINLHTPDLAIDVGANRGQFAKDLRDASYQGPIFSLEPISVLAHELNERAQQTSLPWVVKHGAAGEIEDTLEMNVFVDDTFSSFHTPNAAAIDRFGRMLDRAKTQTVTVKPLDTWIEESPFSKAQRILLKTDTQGHDLSVLAGAVRTLQRTVIFIGEGSVQPIYETGATPAEYTRLLEPFNLRPAGEFPIAHDDKNLTTIEVDCFYTRVKSPQSTPFRCAQP